MAEVEIGMGKSGRRAYGFDDIAIVPSRRTRDPEDVDISWEIDAFRFEPAADGRRRWTASICPPPRSRSVGSAASACSTSRACGPATKIPSRCFDEIAELAADKATLRMQEIYGEPIKPELVSARASARSAMPASCRARRSPRSAPSSSPQAIIAAELDLLVIQGTVVSAEHVSKTVEPLNLKRFVRELDIPVIVGGCASYQAALHLMRTGAAGVLVGVGPGHACTTRGVLGIGVPAGDRHRRRPRRPHAPPRRDRRLRARHRRRRHGHRRRHRQGHRLRRRRGDDRLAARRRRRGAGPRLPLGHGDVPPDAAARRTRARRRTRGTLKEILVGPAHENDGRMNLFGALRTSMATCGYETVKEFQKAEVMVAPALQTEGKSLQKSQGVGMGH